MRRSILAAIGVGIAIVIAVLALAGQVLVPIPQDFPTQNTLIPEPQTSKVKVVASFYPLYEFSKNIAGQKADVTVFVPIGIEPHDWEPSTGDILALKQSDVFVYNGMMETFVEKLVDSGEYPNVLFVETAQGIDLIDANESHADEEHDIQYDPHIWLDPILAKHQVEMIRDALIKVDADNAQYYEDNAGAYSVRLDNLDSKIRAELSDCKKNTFMPFHNAFSYFANRYGLQVFPLSGIDPESEATAAELKEFIDYVRENDIKVIFSEELVDPKLAEVLANEAGAQVMVFSPVEGLSENDIISGKTYIDKMEENLTNLKIALECQ